MRDFWCIIAPMKEQLGQEPKFESKKFDFQQIVEKYKEYNSALDDVVKILDASKNLELEKENIRKNWIPTAKKLREEFENLQKSFEENYGKAELDDLWGNYQEDRLPTGGEGEEEYIEKDIKRMDIEAEFGLVEPPPASLKEKIMENIRKKFEEKGPS